MENLTMAQALRHMAERAEQECATPWDDLQYKHKSTVSWDNVTAACSMFTFSEDFSVRIRPQPKLVNGVECHPHRGELDPGELYYIPNPSCDLGYYGIICARNNLILLRTLLDRGCVYTTAEGALVEARAQGWV